MNLLQALNHLPNLKGLYLQLKDSDEVYIDTLAQALQHNSKLTDLALKYPKVNKNLRQHIFNKLIDMTGYLSNLSSLQIEIHFSHSEKILFKTFLSGLENLHNLVSLSLTMYSNSSKVNEIIELPNVGSLSTLANIKYFTLKGDQNGLNSDLTNYFLSKMTLLKTCSLTNVGLDEETFQQLLRNNELKELNIFCGEKVEPKSLDVLMLNFKKLEKLQYFALQFDRYQPFEFNIENLVKGIGELKNVRRIVIEIGFMVSINTTTLSKLFENISRLKKLTHLTLYLRLQEEIQSSVIKKIFMMNTLIEVSIEIDNMKMNKQTQSFIKTKTKMLKELVGSTVKCIDFLINRNL